MGKVKFTKGDWKKLVYRGFSFYKLTSTCIEDSGFYFEIGPNAESRSTKHRPEWRANSKLVFAAPDMYSAIRAVLDAWDTVPDDEDFMRKMGELTEALRKSLPEGLEE